MNKRMKPALAIATFFTMFALVFSAFITNSQHFTAILAFAGTLIGTITGYYFSSSRATNV